MHKMIIGIADDERDVVDAYESAIKKLGHLPIARNSIRRMMDYLKDPNRKIDILFLDHHFHDEESGVSMISEIIALRPDLDIIVTTKQPLEPHFVQDIVNAGVGFFKKSVIDPVWLEMEISQRINIRNAKNSAIERRLSEFCEHFYNAREGVSRFAFFGRKKKLKAVHVASIERLGDKYIYPQFDLFLTVQAGESREITLEEAWKDTIELKASTAQEIGLKFSDSVKFFGSKLGLQIIEKLKAEQSVAKKKTFHSSYKSGQKIQLLESEYKVGVRRKEFYRGILHEAYKIIIKIDCMQCGSSDEVDVFILAPNQIVEVAVAYDKKGMVFSGEDGRNGYETWQSSSKLLTK